jgi:DNA-binding transcriptional MerR regulator
MGVASKPGGPRVYRRADVEQVLRIKHLLFNEGLTLAGARRKLEGEPKVEEEPLPELPVAGDVREKVTRVKQELRSLLELLAVRDHGEAAKPGAPAGRRAGLPSAGPGPNEESTGEAAPGVTEIPSSSTSPGAQEGVAGGPSMPEPILPLLEGVPEPAAPAQVPRRPRRQAKSVRDSH